LDKELDKDFEMKTKSIKTEFKGVYGVEVPQFHNNTISGVSYRYDFTINSTRYATPIYNGFKEAREAALAMDKKLISLGQEPRHILKRKEFV
jgi:hypothetical protein